jgi:uncharacterized protein
MNWLWMSLHHAFAMFWQTFWALVLGFGISAALQVFVSKEEMTRAFGRTNWRSMALATGLGAASSSCSYAAAAAARSAVQQGAALIPALAFMFASTNLVMELGAMIWALMGWQFVLAEVVGACILIACMWLLARWIFPKDLERAARENAQHEVERAGCCSHESEASPGNRFTQVAHAFVADWRMLWKEITLGFLIAGFIAALVPIEWWKFLFVESGPPWLRLIENAAVGPLIAIPSFICSCANIPLANLLWRSGISFGGVISFIYADLLIIPLLMVYAKYYGLRVAAYITGIFYGSIVIAGIVVDLIFSKAGLVPQGSRVESAMSHEMITWNYTSWLNLGALVVGGFLMIRHLRDRGSREAHHAHH